jgi:hypothetical protein
MQYGQFMTTNGHQCRVNGCLPSDHLPNKDKLRQNFSNHVCCSASQLPPKVDLRPDMTPVENQSTIGSW